MSWQIIHRILGLALVDTTFWQALQNDPRTALREGGFQLTDKEQEAFCNLPRNNLSEFSQQLLESLPAE